MAYPYDPAQRPGASLFGQLMVPQPEALPEAPQSLVQVPEAPRGILGRIGSALQNPRLSQQLLSMGTEMLANSGYQRMPVTTGVGVGRGLQAFQQAGQSYDQMIAQQAADQFNRKIQEAQLKRAEEGDPLKYQFGGGVLTEQDGVKGFAIPVQNPQTGQIESRFVPIGDKIVDRSTGMTAQDKAELDAWAAGNVERQKLLAKLGMTSDIAQSEATIAGATKAAEAQAQAQAEKEGVASGAQSMLEVIDEAGNLIPKSSQSVITDWIASGASKIGISSDAATANRQLESLGSQLVAEMAKSKILGPNPSEGDRITYERLAGRVRDPGDIESRMAALDQLRKMAQRNIDRANKGAGKPEKPPAPSAKPRSRDEILKQYGVQD